MIAKIYGKSNKFVFKGHNGSPSNENIKKPKF
jgi:hypothetical protein